jgi:hypothetical protein
VFENVEQYLKQFLTDFQQQAKEDQVGKEATFWIDVKQAYILVLEEKIPAGKILEIPCQFEKKMP